VVEGGGGGGKKGLEDAFVRFLGGEQCGRSGLN